MKRFVQSLFAIILVIGLSNVTLAQYSNSGNDNITAEAQVTSNLAITGVQNLDFGQVYVSTTESVAESDVGAGHFQITSVSSSDVELEFTLPSQLSDGSNTLPISFGSGDASWDGNTDNNLFDPNNTEDATVGSDSFLDVYIGGTVTPGTSQTAGNYSAQITLTANYN